MLKDVRVGFSIYSATRALVESHATQPLALQLVMVTLGCVNLSRPVPVRGLNVCFIADVARNNYRYIIIHANVPVLLDLHAIIFFVNPDDKVFLKSH